MEYRYLGSTGVRLSQLVLGAGMFGAWGNTDRDDCVRIIHAALNAGINMIDVSDVYSAGEAEEIVGKGIAGRRDDVLVATKVFSPMGDGPNQQGASRRWIVEECENSLRRLGVDHIDLYQIHKLDEHTDLDETLGALSDLIHQGKVRYAGSSSFPAAAIVEGQWVAARRGRERFVCEQPPYSMLVRGIEAEILPTCQKHELGVITWSPVAGGWLSGDWHTGTDELVRRRAHISPARYDLSSPANEAKLKATKALAALAAEAGYSLPNLAVAFVLNHPAVAAAICGPQTNQHLEDYLRALDVELTGDILDRIDEIVAPGTNFSWVDAGYRPTSILEPSRRRRRGEASAAT